MIGYIRTRDQYIHQYLTRKLKNIVIKAKIYFSAVIAVESAMKCLEMHANEAKGSVQSRIDPFASFACQTADNYDNRLFQFIKILTELQGLGE